jgi:hypothetical protein
MKGFIILCLSYKYILSNDVEGSRKFIEENLTFLGKLLFNNKLKDDN